MLHAALTYGICAGIPDGDIDVLRPHNQVACGIELSDVGLAPHLAVRNAVQPGTQLGMQSGVCSASALRPLKVEIVSLAAAAAASCC